MIREFTISSVKLAIPPPLPWPIPSHPITLGILFLTFRTFEYLLLESNVHFLPFNLMLNLRSKRRPPKSINYFPYCIIVLSLLYFYLTNELDLTLNVICKTLSLSPITNICTLPCIQKLYSFVLKNLSTNLKLTIWLSLLVILLSNDIELNPGHDYVKDFKLHLAKITFTESPS